MSARDAMLLLGAALAACDPQPRAVTPAESPQSVLAVGSGDVQSTAVSASAEPAAPAAPPCDDLVLQVGKTGGMPLSDVKSFAVSAPGVVSVSIAPGGATLAIAGKAPGMATLRVVHKDGHEEAICVRVEPRP